MRHYYKSHGKHCYLRSFQSRCPRCNANVLFWECAHGSKVFFEYPPYGKLVRHICRYRKGSYNLKNPHPVIVKKPKGLLEYRYLSCPICGKLFKDASSLDNHLENLKKNDINNMHFVLNRISFEDDLKQYVQTERDKIKTYDMPKFGKVNIKKQKKDD